VSFQQIVDPVALSGVIAILVGKDEVHMMVAHSDHDRPATTSWTDSLLMRLAAYFILEPVASSVALGILVGGIGGNFASFALGTLVGAVAASILRRKHQDGRI
jgi:hypothetical protein